MFVRQSVHQEWELAKWIALFALAFAVTLAFASSIAGAVELRPPRHEPAPLPNKIESWSSPMADYLTGQSFPTEDVSREVWKAIDLLHHEQYDEAIAAWSELRMPEEADVWRHVALGQAYLATGKIEKAAEALFTADKLRQENGVVHYYLGVLRLEQAYMADDWYDAVGPADTVFTALGPYDVVPNSKSMCKLAAIMEFEQAIRHGPDTWLDEPLVPPEWPTEAAMEPRVHDLLLAMRANDFVAKAHNMMGSLYLDKGLLEEAEDHMDEAVAGGLSVVYGYSDLAKEYEESGRTADAARAYLKAATQEPDKIAPLRDALENLLKSIF